MVAKTVKLPRAVDVRLRREAKARQRSYSALMREAIVRGLDRPTGIDMTQALAGFIGAGEGPGDLSTNKNYRGRSARKLVTPPS